MHCDVVDLARNVEDEYSTPIIAAWHHPSGWVWLAIEEEGNGLYYGFVVSPVWTEPEWLTFGEAEPMGMDAIRVSAECLGSLSVGPV